jgi:S-methylmethionine-dependent homocysteine/selenocysteine methylase
MSYTSIKAKLAAGQTIILDGGTGTDIQKRGAPMSGDTWCAEANATHPEIVRAVHDDYIKVGANIITANTFATSVLSFNCYGRDDDVLAYDKIAVTQALNAAKGHDVAVAGSVSTMRPVVKGSDRTDLSVNWTPDEARILFGRKIANLKNCGVDLLIMEMMRDTDYSLYACEAAVESGLPVWIGISVERSDDGLLSGFGRKDQLLKDFTPALAALKPEVMCIMHTSPQDTGEAIDILKQSWSGPIGAYPESGYFKSPEWVFTEVTPGELVAAAKSWQKLGVSIFGGCCGIGPEHIAALNKEFAA